MGHAAARHTGETGHQFLLLGAAQLGEGGAHAGQQLLLLGTGQVVTSTG